MDLHENGERRPTQARMKRSPHLSIRRHTSSYAHSHFHSISAGFAPWAHSGVWPTGKLDSGASSGRFFGCGNRDSAYVHVSRPPQQGGGAGSAGGRRSLRTPLVFDFEWLVTRPIASHVVRKHMFSQQNAISKYHLFSISSGL